MNESKSLLKEELDEMPKIEDAKLALRQEPEVRSLMQSIDGKDQVAVLEFGKETADNITAFSDRMLRTMNGSKMEESSVLISNLNKVMDKFDPKDFEEADNGLLSKIFNRGKKYLEKVMAKYETMGKEIDNIYIEIQKYDAEMKKNTLDLEHLYEENAQYFDALGKYACAAKMKAEEMQNKLKDLEKKAATGNQMASMELESTRIIIQLLEQRSFDLEMAQQVAFQSAPQIRLMQQGNNKLIGKINSAFVTTIPIFKQGLIQAVSIKRQKLVADSLSELDKRTNEMLVNNARNISKNSVDIAHLASSPSIKIETMEETWGIIMNGIIETKEIEQEASKNRENGRQRIQQLQNDYEKLKNH